MQSKRTYSDYNCLHLSYQLFTFQLLVECGRLGDAVWRLKACHVHILNGALSSGLSHWKQDILELEDVQKNKDYQWTGISYVQAEIKYAVQLGMRQLW